MNTMNMEMIDILLKMGEEGTYAIRTKSERTAKTLYNKFVKFLERINMIRIDVDTPMRGADYSFVGGYEMWRDVYYPKLVSYGIIDPDYKSIGRNFTYYGMDIRAIEKEKSLARQFGETPDWDTAQFIVEINELYGFTCGKGKPICKLVIIPENVTNTKKNQVSNDMKELIGKLTEFLGTYNLPGMLYKQLKYAANEYTSVTKRQLQYVIKVANKIMETNPPVATDRQNAYIAQLLDTDVENISGKLNKYQASELIEACTDSNDLTEEQYPRESILKHYEEILK